MLSYFPNMRAQHQGYGDACIRWWPWRCLGRGLRTGCRQWCCPPGSRCLKCEKTKKKKNHPHHRRRQGVQRISYRMSTGLLATHAACLGQYDSEGPDIKLQSKSTTPVALTVYQSAPQINFLIPTLYLIFTSPKKKFLFLNRLRMAHQRHRPLTPWATFGLTNFFDKFPSSSLCECGAFANDEGTLSCFSLRSA